MAAQPILVDAAPVANVEAEAALCGALMMDNRLIDRVADRLAAEDFFEGLFGRLYSAILKEYSLGRPANPVTLVPYFSEDEGMKGLGGARKFLPGLTGSGAAVMAAEGSAAQIKALAKRRALIAGLTAAREMANSYDATNEEVIAHVETAVADVLEERDGLSEMDAGRAIAKSLERDEKGHDGVHSGIASLDASLGPIKRKQLIVVAGRPGMGKTAMAVSYSVGAASRGHGVLLISLEMGAEELGGRIAADICYAGGGVGIPYAAIESGNLSSEQGRAVARAAADAGDMPLQIVDVPTLTIGRLLMIARRWQRRFAARGQKLELVVVDYLQLLRPDHKVRDRFEAIAEVSIGLKGIAKTLGVGVMALAQLSRKVEERPDKRPQLADLRESGQIEQDADGILFLYRPAYYLAKDEPPLNDPSHLQWESSMSEVEHQMEFIVAKRRGRPSAIGRGFFYGAFQAVRG